MSAITELKTEDILERLRRETDARQFFERELQKRTQELRAEQEAHEALANRLQTPQAPTSPAEERLRLEAQARQFLEQQLRQRTSELQAAEQRRQALEEQLAERQSAPPDEQAQRLSLEAEAKRFLEQELQKRTRQLQEAQQDKDALEGRYSSQTEALTSELHLQKSLLLGAEKQLAAKERLLAQNLAQAAAGYEQRIAGMEAELAKQSQRVAEATAREQKLQLEFARLKEQSEAAESARKNIERELSPGGGSVTQELARQKAALEQTTQEASRQTEQLKGQSAEIAKQTAARIEALERDLAAERSALHAALGKEQTLQAQLAEQSAELQASRSDRERQQGELSNEIEALSKEVRELKATLTTAQEKLTGFEQRQSGAAKDEKLAQQARGSAEVLTARVTALEAELTRQAAELDAARKGEQSAESQVKEQQSKLAQAELDTLALGCYGGPVKTPNLDRLAREGVLFQHAYCQYPLCNPSRASFLGGRRPITTHIYGNDVHPKTFLKNVAFLPEYFRKQGYFTARYGKIAHNPFENQLAWDISQDAGWKLFPDMTPEQQWSMSPAQIFKLITSRPIDWKASEHEDADEPDGRSARRVAALLQHPQDKAFFIGLGFHLPHVPFVAPKKYFDLYPLDRIVLPQRLSPKPGQSPRIAYPMQFQGNMTELQAKQAVAAYYASVSYLDAQLGLVIDELDKGGLRDNTIIVFFSDHGFSLGEHGIWQKLSLFDESARVPLIISLPAKFARSSAGKARRVVSEPVELLDLFPTLVQLANLPMPQGIEGRSLLPLLRGHQKSWRLSAQTEVARPRRTKTDVWEWLNSLNVAEKQGIFGRSVNTGRYRYTEWDEGRAGVELYDHASDPRENHNLAGHRKFRSLQARLRAMLHKTKPAKVTDKPAKF